MYVWSIFVIAKRVLIRSHGRPLIVCVRMGRAAVSCARAPAIPWNLPLGRPVSLPQLEQHGRDPALRSVHAHSAWQFLLPTSQGTRVITSKMQMPKTATGTDNLFLVAAPKYLDLPVVMSGGCSGCSLF